MQKVSNLSLLFLGTIFYIIGEVLRHLTFKPLVVVGIVVQIGVFCILLWISLKVVCGMVKEKSCSHMAAAIMIVGIVGLSYLLVLMASGLTIDYGSRIATAICTMLQPLWAVAFFNTVANVTLKKTVLRQTT